MTQIQILLHYKFYYIILFLNGYDNFLFEIFEVIFLY